jgi:hypothetical protein
MEQQPNTRNMLAYVRHITHITVRSKRACVVAAIMLDWQACAVYVWV